MISKLVRNSTPKWVNMVKLPFLKSIINGKLSKEAFLEYLVQDTIYIKYYAKCYAYAMTKTDDIEVMRLLYECLGIISKDESAIHIIYLKDLGYTELKALSEPMYEVNKNYLDYMLYFSVHGTLQQNIVSLVPCAVSYFYIAKECKKEAMRLGTYESNYYKKWMNFYSSDSYKKSCEKLLKLCDLILKNMGSSDMENLRNIFEKSTYYEKLFWGIPRL